MIGWLFRLASLLGLPSWIVPAALAGIFLSALGGAYLKGRFDAAANCREAALTSEIAILRADLAAQRLAAEFEANNRKYLEAQNARNEKELAEYEQELAKRNSALCTLDPADVKRLRQIGPH